MDNSSVWSENDTELLSSFTGTTIYMREVNYDLSSLVISLFLMSTWTCNKLRVSVQFSDKTGAFGKVFCIIERN